MNFRTGFNFFKQTTRMFKAPSVPFAAYSNNMQKVVNKALINQSSRAIQLISLNNYLNIKNISELIEKCEQKSTNDEIISAIQGIISDDNVMTRLWSSLGRSSKHDLNYVIQ